MLELLEPSFSSLTTIRLGGRACALIKPENQDDLALLAAYARKWNAPLLPIGRGSNLLARDGSINVVLVSLELLNEIEIIEKCPNQTIVAAYAGAPLARLLRFCLQKGLSGLEGLAGIPGSVGGACAMNAGSFGVCAGDRIVAIEVWEGNNPGTFRKADLEFGYRSLKIRNHQILPLVTRVFFALTEADKSVIFGRMNLNILNKKSRQPVTAWSAGCAFKNPPLGPSAGRLLEDCGFRGFVSGGMAFSPVHANFLVNTGCGTAAQAIGLLQKARHVVKRQTGISLEPEIRVFPCPLP